MRSPKVSYGLALPWSTCRSSRGFLAVLTPALVAALACGEAVESPTAPSSERALAPAATATLAFRQVSAGYYHTCGVTTDDRAFCWGEGSSGELGDGTNTSQLSPVAVAGGLRFRQVSAGTSYTCGVTIDDAAYCWGDNGAGQLGDGTQTSCGGYNPPCTDPETNANRARPVRVLGGLRFRQVDAGSGGHTCGVTRDNLAYCWGNNFYGQLGDNAKGEAGRYTNRPMPVAVAGGISFRQVSAGGAHTCGVATDDRAYCWGYNIYGQVGDGTDIRRRIRPVLVAGGLRFKQVSAGGAHQQNGHTCGVTTGGRAFCWGDGRLGQIGDRSTILRFTPRAVAGALDFRQVSAGGVHTCGTTTTSVAFCWGNNSFGAVGDGTTTQRLTPVRVSGGLGFRQLGTGGVGHTCGTTVTEVAYCWGFNVAGGLGDGTTTDRLKPRAVAGSM
jgi:alpha-tubulin suppressor-like RCC1 family protein